MKPSDAPHGVLIVEDDPAHAELIVRAFDRIGPLRLQVAGSAAEARRILSDGPVDLIVADYRLPDAEPRWIAAHVESCPVIVITAFGSEQAAVEVMKAGAADYVVKSPEAFAEMPRLAGRVLREWRHLRERDRSDALLRALAEQSSEGIAMVAEDGTFQLVNRRFAAMVGRAEADLLGAPATSVMSGPVADDLLRPALGGTSGICETTLVGRAGTPIAVEIAIGPVILAGECFALAFFRDITERVQAREERSRLEGQLRQWQKMEAIGTLAGGIAHDFNNLLFAISGYTELAVEKLDDEHPARHDLTHLMRAAGRARDLVGQILTFSRTQEQAKRVEDLTPIVRESLRMLRATLPAGVELTSDLWSGLPHVAADATQIQQVVMNLCTNAWHALPGGVGKISISLQDVQVGDAWARMLPGLAPGTYVCLTVRDNGSGMEPAVLDRVFEPFFTTKPVGSGTGLGLSVVHGIVKSHQGAVTARSAPGRGSTFKVFLPAVAAAQYVSPAPESGEAPGDRRRVLYVDDEPELVSMVAGLLRVRGFEVVECSTAEDAVEACSGGDSGFDALLTDLNMPNMSGLEVAARIRSARPELPIVVISGMLGDAEMQRARGLGIFEFVAKPVSAHELANALRRAIGNKPA